MSLSLLDYVLWAISPILLVLTFGALLRRNLTSDLPVFTAYVLFTAVKDVALAAIYLRGYVTYFYSYWIAEAISVTLGFAVFCELYRKLLEHYDALRRFGITVLGCTGVLLLLCSVLTAAWSPITDTSAPVRVVLLMQLIVRIVHCGLLALLFLFTLYFALPWQGYLFGIALGFGLYASAELAVAAARSHIGPALATAYAQIRAAAYDSCVLIWIGYLVAINPAAYRLVGLRHRELDKWNQVLVEIRQR